MWLAALVLVAAPASDVAPIQLGESLAVPSVTLKQKRTINVVLPLDYSKDLSRRWPVVYVIDGGIDQDLLHVAGTAWLGALWGRNQDAIVVGVATQDRRKELVGPTRDPALLKQFPTAGQSAAFRTFIRDEVKPMVARRYRTDGKDAVVGESLAGLFIVETWLKEPSLFGGYGAVSPSLWWDKEALSKSAAGFVGTRQRGHPLYLTVGDEGREMQGGVERVATLLARPGLSGCYAPRKDLTHSTIYHTVSPTVFQYLLPPKEEPDQAFGFTITCAPLPGAKR